MYQAPHLTIRAWVWDYLASSLHGVYWLPYTCRHFTSIPAAGVDYTAVNTPELRFTRGNAQIRDSDSIDVMILTDADNNESEETFYLNFNPRRNAIFQPPRIEIKICGSKHKFYLKCFLLYSKNAHLHCMLPGRFNCISIHVAACYM